MTQTSSSMFADTLAKLHALESQQLSILTLAEPIIASTSKISEETRRDDPQPLLSPPSHNETSTTTTTHLTPSLLSADLSHYRDLFSKLRFSYLEQVTKEKYLRGIVGDPPILVSHADNVRLEDEVGSMKTALKKRKREVLEELVIEIEGLAGEVARVYTGVQGAMEVVREMVGNLKELEGREEVCVGRLAEYKVRIQGAEDEDKNPRMNLGLAQTDKLVQERRVQMQEMDRQVSELQERSLPRRMKECETVERDLDLLEKKRDQVAAAAREARKVKEEGGRDRVEELGRWYRAAEGVFKGLGLDVSRESGLVDG